MSTGGHFTLELHFLGCQPPPKMVEYLHQVVRTMIYRCCFCGKPIAPESLFTLSVRKEGCETEQVLFCHETCLEHALYDAKELYLKCL